MDHDNALDSDEFAVFSYLVDAARSGEPIPESLPLELMPPSKRNIKR